MTSALIKSINMWYHMRRSGFTRSKPGDGKLSPDSGSFPFFPSIVYFCVNSVFFFTLLFVQALSSSGWHAAPSALASLSPACVKSFPLLHYVLYTGTPSSPWIYSITPFSLYALPNVSVWCPLFHPPTSLPAFLSLPLSLSLVFSYRLHSMSVFFLSYLHSEAREDLCWFSCLFLLLCFFICQ